MKHLMILRCGTKSIHKSWIHLIQKIMDIAFVYYDNADFSQDNPTYTYKVEGTKLSGVHDFIINNPDIINQYDFFWLFEDDLYISYQSARKIVNFINKFQPVLSAPSLTLESFFTHPITLQQQTLLLRGTDFIECMAPIMSRKFLKNTLAQLKEFPLWGIERYWQHLLWEMQEIAFIYDQWPIIHTRALGTGSLYQTAEKLHIDFLADDSKARDLYGGKFNHSLPTILFGLTNQSDPEFLIASQLKKHINFNYYIFEEIFENVANPIHNELLHQSNHRNTLFSQFLSFSTVQKLLSIRNFSPDESNIIVREWAYGSQTDNVCWCNNMQFDMKGRVHNYYHENEYYWKIINGNLNLISKDEKISTIFDHKEITPDNKIKLIGKFNGNEHQLHYLEERH